MSEKPRRRVYWIVGTLVVLFLICGGSIYLLGGIIQGITGMFVTPANPTNEPDVIHQIHGPPPNALSFSPDGKLLAILAPKWREIQGDVPIVNPPLDLPQLTVYDVATGAKAFTLNLTRWPRSLAFSPDGKQLAVGLGGPVQAAPDKLPPTELVIYAVPGFAESSRSSPGADFQPDRLMFNPDGTLLFAFRTDDIGAPQSVSAWRFPEMTALPKFTTVIANPHCATTTADGTILIGGKTKDGLAAVERFDLSGNRLGKCAIPDQTFGPVFALLPDATGKSVTACYPDAKQAFDASTGQPIGGRKAYPIEGVGFRAMIAAGSRMALAWSVPSSMAPDFRPWYQKGEFLHAANLTTGANRKWWTGVRDGLVAFSPDGKLIAGEFDGNAQGRPVRVKVWVSP